jgi:xanthine dehydrogenase YagS FAD-binding subunit
MPSTFAYVRPTSLRQAVERLALPGARAHAGGTDLLGCLRDRVFGVDTVVSLSSLPELKGISERPDGSLRVGALTTLAELAGHPRIGERYAALAQGAASAASPQLRNQGTLGGNLCQRPRCWYFRGGFHCARQGGDTCYALSGENAQHALFGGSGCYVVHPSDTAAPLVALQARLAIVGPAGERIVPAESFFVPPARDLTRETVLGPGEVLVEVLLPPAVPGSASAYRKARAREVWDFALAGAAVAVRTSAHRVAECRVVLSGVAPIPWRSQAAEAALAGRRLDAAAAARASAAAIEGAEPMEHNGYKVPLLRTVVEDAVLALAGVSARG